MNSGIKREGRRSDGRESEKIRTCRFWGVGKFLFHGLLEPKFTGVGRRLFCQEGRGNLEIFLDAFRERGGDLLLSIHSNEHSTSLQADIVSPFISY